jgi:hypothetical protein
VNSSLFDKRPFVVNAKTTTVYDVYVGRPSKWGNPFKLKADTFEERAKVLRLYEQWLLGLVLTTQKPPKIADIKRELRGKVLACYCAPKPCHAEVLARIANE